VREERTGLQLRRARSVTPAVCQSPVEEEVGTEQVEVVGGQKRRRKRRLGVRRRVVLARASSKSTSSPPLVLPILIAY
jgi:hypothetical protein